MTLDEQIKQHENNLVMLDYERRVLVHKYSRATLGKKILRAIPYTAKLIKNSFDVSVERDKVEYLNEQRRYGSWEL